MDNQELLSKAEIFITDHFENNVPKKYVFHTISHVKSVVDTVKLLTQGYNMKERDKVNLILAAWFHDAGYNEGPEGHEERSCQIMSDFIKECGGNDWQIKAISDLIMATKMPQNPGALPAAILCDADLNHLGNALYWDRCSKIRQEMYLSSDRVMTDNEWVDFELDFMLHHQYHSGEAERHFGDQKRKHIRQLEKRKRRLNPEIAQQIIQEEALLKESKSKKKKKKKITYSADGSLELKELNLGRGVETMYRATYRTHVNLSSIADNKANIMLSINAIIISIVIGSLVPRFTSMPQLIFPTAILLGACLTALVFAIMSTRPKVTEGRVTMKDIEEKRSNLLFFGNFYNMKIEEFHYGMMEMIKDTDFLYSTMTRDLYFLGKVLAQKYKYLRICYNIFMYGLIFSVFLFGMAMLR